MARNYELRYILLVVINTHIRPKIAMFFSDYTTSSHSFISVCLLTLFLICFIFTSLKIPLTTNGSLSWPRFGYSQILPQILCFGFISSLRCPTFIFAYIYVFIIISSLCPSFYDCIHPSLIFMQFVWNAFRTFT